MFGDSFSEVGNIYNASNGSQPGVWSYDGRYSDGRVWQEYLFQFFGLPNELKPSSQGGTNHAYGGATVDNSYIDSFSTYLQDYVPSVKEQVTEYIYNENVDVSPQRLHVLYPGYNDYWWYIHRNFTTSDGQDMNFTKIYTTVANSIVEQMDRLYAIGARKFLIGNVVRMSKWAEASLHPQDVLESYELLVNWHNEVLANLLSDFGARHNDADVFEQDNYRAFECIRQHKDWIGIKFVDVPCHPTQEDNCEPVFDYAYWDWYHPSTRAHFIASTFALQSMFDKQTKQYVKTSLRNRY